MPTLKVIYEDNHLIVVIKPAGLATQGDETGDVCLMDVVKDYLKEKYNKPGKVFLGLLHRLDRPVSGIVILAKTSKGASRLSEQIRNHEMKKEYSALVTGKLKNKKGTLINFLKHNEKNNKAEIFDREVAGSQRAELDYEVVKEIKGNTLVKINLKTGRHHQIRVQFAHLGHPLIGDIKYGAEKPLSDKSIALFADKLTFKTATGDKEMVLEYNDFDYGKNS